MSQMTHRPKYVLIWKYDHYAILNDDVNFMVGHVDLDSKNKVFRVRADLADDYCSSHVGAVGVLSEAIPALANFYENNPPQWKIEELALWRKETQYGLLRVERDRGGRWRAYRDNYPLLRGANPANFRTDDEARSAADAHLLDFYPGHQPLNDGLSWLPDPQIDWRSDPQLVKNRAFMARLANEDKQAMTMQRVDLTMQRVDLLKAARAALEKNASALQRRAISSRVCRTNGLVKDSLMEGIDARAMRLLGIRP